MLCCAVLQHARPFRLLMFFAYCCLSQEAQRQPWYGMHELGPFVRLTYVVLVQQLICATDTQVHKLTDTDRQTDRFAGRQTDRQT